MIIKEFAQYINETLIFFNETDDKSNGKGN
jgi:hypothetical protein